MNLLNDLLINTFRWLRILLQYAQNVKVIRSLSEKERHQNIDVTTVATNSMILKPGLFIPRKNKKMIFEDDTPILMNK
jgi:hypothetical protein